MFLVALFFLIFFKNQICYQSCTLLKVEWAGFHDRSPFTWNLSIRCNLSGWCVGHMAASPFATWTIRRCCWSTASASRSHTSSQGFPSLSSFHGSCSHLCSLDLGVSAYTLLINETKQNYEFKVHFGLSWMILEQYIMLNPIFALRSSASSWTMAKDTMPLADAGQPQICWCGVAWGSNRSNLEYQAN